jgi:deoxycytidylate deaminase
MHEMFEDLFERASLLETCGGARVAACLTNGRGIYAYGYGQKKTHPFQKKFGRSEEHIYLHAEVDAIKNWINSNHAEDLIYCELYIMRVKKVKGLWVTGLSIPCVGCMRAINAFGISYVYFTQEDATEFSIL